MINIKPVSLEGSQTGKVSAFFLPTESTGEWASWPWVRVLTGKVVVIPVWLLGVSLYFSRLRVFSENLQKALDSEHTFNFVLTCDCEKWKIREGGTRIWTGDLLICSQMLYHWAIPPLLAVFWQMLFTSILDFFFFSWKFFFQNQFLLATRYWIVITRNNIKRPSKNMEFWKYVNFCLF